MLPTLVRQAIKKSERLSLNYISRSLTQTMEKRRTKMQTAMIMRGCLYPALTFT